VQASVAPTYWIDLEEADTRREGARAALVPIVALANRLAADLSEAEMRCVDYAVVSQAGFPAYLGGPFAFAASR
jgi:3-hydroxyacyl-CoA dehydrogenase/enoyl-CoA hydratase/3-hydroxybutyryl-CoA epimerase